MPPGQQRADTDRHPGDLDAAFTAPRFMALLGLLLIVTFPGVVAGTHSFFFRDFGTLAYPFVHYHRESFWRGELPLWNPLSNCGTPFMAQWNTLVLYPFSLVYLLLPMPWSLNWFCLLHLLWAGLGMYLLARQWTRNGLAASVAGVGYVFGGVTMSSHIYPNYLVTLGWMPWVVWLVERAWREGGRTIVLAALAGALQMLSGAPELILQTWLLLLALWAGQLLLERRATTLWRFPLVVALVAGLTAAQLLPFFDLLAHSQRGPAYAGQLWTMPGWGWASFLVPLFHCFATPQGVLVQAGQAFITSYYPGIGITAFALLALRHAPRRRAWLLAALGALSLVLALGETGLLYGWLRRGLPMLGITRFPIKFVYLPAFIAPLLAACALASLAGNGAPSLKTRGRQILGLGLVVAVGMAALAAFAWRHPSPDEVASVTIGSAASRAMFLAGMLVATSLLARARVARAGWLARAALLALVWLDLWTHTPVLAPVIGNVAYAGDVAELRPKPRAGQSRIMPTPRAEVLLLTRTLPNFVSDFLGSRLALWSNLNVLEGVPKVNGAATLQLREQAEIEGKLYATATNAHPPLEAFLGVSHVSSPENPVEWIARTNYLPFITIGQRPIFVAPAETLRRLFSPAFDPAGEVLLPPELKPALTAGRAESARVLSSVVEANRVEAQVESAAPALMVVAQSYYHPWRASVDGRPAPLWRANHAFQALEVPAGRHQVRLVYVDERFRAGAVLSALTLTACAGAWWRFRRGLQPGA